MSPISEARGSSLRLGAQVSLALTPLCLLPLFAGRHAPLHLSAVQFCGYAALAAATYALGIGLAGRRGPAAARGYLLAGLAFGALATLGPYGATIATTTLALSSWAVWRHKTRFPERRADMLILAFVPALVLLGVLFAGWMLTAMLPTTLLMNFVGDANAGFERSPWLTHFGGGTAISWLIIIAATTLSCPWLATRHPDRPKRTASLMIAAAVGGAGLLTTLNVFDDPLCLLAVCAGATGVVFHHHAGKRRIFWIALSGCGVLLSALMLAPLAPRSHSATLIWTLPPNRSDPPAWGVAPQVREDFPPAIDP